MNPYLLSLFALALGLLGQAVAAGMAFECCLRPGHDARRRALWLALAMASVLLGLHHGYSFELALETGLYDFRQAVLAGLSGLLYGITILIFSRRA